MFRQIYLPGPESETVLLLTSQHMTSQQAQPNLLRCLVFCFQPVLNVRPLRFLLVCRELRQRDNCPLRSGLGTEMLPSSE